MKKFFFFSIIMLCMIQRPYAQVFDTAWAHKFQHAIDSNLALNPVRGSSVGIYVPGHGLFQHSDGIASTGIPVTAQTRFAIGSNTKAFVGTLMLKLQEQGVLSLDDQLHQWLPAFPYVDSTITIRRLLKHESGLYDYFNDNPSIFDSILADTSHYWTPLEVLATIGPPHFKPGHGYSYSNTNYLLAGMIIEAATGTPWWQKMHELILDPLGMTNTFLGGFEPPNGPVANEWWDTMEVVNTPMPAFYSIANAAGSIFSTPEDMTHWYYELMNGTLLTQDSRRQLLDLEATSNYGLGIGGGYIYYNGYRYTYSHTGGTISSFSNMSYDIASHSVICILTNEVASNPYALFNTMYIAFLKYFPKIPDDAGIAKVVKPWLYYCTTSVEPAVWIKNNGSSPISVVDVNYQVDGGSVFTYAWTGTLAPGATVNLILPAMTVPNGFHSFRVYTSLPNGTADLYNLNDTCFSNFIVNDANGLTLPLTEDFEGPSFPPPGWCMGAANILQWGRTHLAAASGNFSAVRNNYLDWWSIGFYDLYMPLLNLNSISNPVLKFNYAYSFIPTYNDALSISVSSDCGMNWLPVFSKSGVNLGTVPIAAAPFYPDTISEWSPQSISLSQFTGNILIRFRSQNAYGNLLYIDDVEVSSVAGMAEITQNNDLKVYPNPAKNIVNVSGMERNDNVCLMDMTGRLIECKRNTEGQLQFDLSALAPGMYLIQSEEIVKKVLRY
ncbi:MAG: serine hydrolase [Bacteroidetes bacterium]|nr:serine hydrolase [Bacteroidota bacterium]